MPPLLRLQNITRRFGGATALDTVCFDLLPGEVHALVGENGAGKSTLINLISGLLAPDAGEILLDGRPNTLESPVAARRLGIAVVHQEPDVFESLSVAETMALAHGLPTGPAGWVRWQEVEQSARAAVATMGEPIDVLAPAGSLAVAQRQMIQIAAAVTRRSRIVLLDEPTSSLSRAESEWLFQQIARLKADGAGIVYISHRFEEIARLADRITVLRDGQVAWTGQATAIDHAGIVKAMVGRETTLVPHTASDSHGPVRLQVDGATDSEGRFEDISLAVRGGEVLGIYGLVGAGRSEWAQGLFGLRTLSAGTIAIDERTLTIRTPTDAVRAGLAYLPEDRLRQGVFPTLPIRVNLTIASLTRFVRGLFLSRRDERSASQATIAALAVKSQSIEQPIQQLSGGNQQKVVFGRWQMADPKVLLLDEPTRGVDVGAKGEIHKLIRESAETGLAVVLISSDLPEVLTHADRVAVFRTGRLAALFSRDAATAENVLAAALPQAGEQSRAVRPRRRFIDPQLVGRVGLLAVIGGLALVLSLTTGGRFATLGNLLGLLEKVAVVGLLSVGAATVIIAGGIDISVGSLMALAAGGAGLAMRATGGTAWGTALGGAVALVTGLGGGLANATASRIGRIHPVVVTLGAMTIYRGLLLHLTGGNVIGDLPASFRSLTVGRFLGIQRAAYVLIATAAAVSVWMGSIRSGRHLFAYGSNPRAARLVGISQNRTWLTAFGIGGLCAGLAGLMELGQNGSMQSSMGAGYELKAITAAVIGGTAVTGGRGSAWGAVLGAILLALVQNGLVLWGVSPYRYDLVIGGLLATAILVERFTRRNVA
ncbi:MAG: ATP-binding cassette domain-containing protein [Planctomycetota bacterium]|nr:ATP-binding cassette domain-containing protein [Planctomycetota bacterium]